MLRQALQAVSISPRAQALVERAPLTRDVVHRFIAGETMDEALRATDEIVTKGLLVSLDVLGEDTRDADQADRTVRYYEDLLHRLADANVSDRAEVSLKLTAVGQALDPDLALDNARRVCEAARAAGTTVTIDTEDHTTVESTLESVRELRRDFPSTGAVIQAYLRRAEEFCADLAFDGSRVRLCKGAYGAPEEVAFTRREDIDKSYVRCLKVLMAGKGYPMVATHDPRLIDIAGALAVLNERGTDTFEYQMLYGIRPQEQTRIARSGARMRVYVAYGTEWYGYFLRRLAERPANLAFFVRSVVTRD
ncbi:proline dehydrogenase family protein [Actinomadura atramentaria]|uniref:proline dehydrogenase family protein n=1 Tax=Actinomadura atramentaria TaxID=1990 RepID=UPI00039DEBF5|nr:proline dehydrogenase family protein [Actinomadura atramentaria]